MRREGKSSTSAMAGAVGGARGMSRQTGVTPKPVRVQPAPRQSREARRVAPPPPRNSRPPRHDNRVRRNYGRPTPPPSPHNGYTRPPRRGGRRRGSCFSYFAAFIIMLVIVLLVYFGDDLKEKFFGNDDIITNEEVSSNEELSVSFRNETLLNEHYEKHGVDMGFSSAQSYEAAACKVVENENALHKIEAEDGDDVYYLESTNEFVIVSTDGYIRTYFCPEDGIEYYNRQ